MSSLAQPKRRKILSLSDQLVDAIKEKIVNNEYAPGSVLQIDVLAAEHDVSTTPVREALLRLMGEGFVSFMRNKGAIVADIDDAVISDVYEYRSLLEEHAAVHACSLDLPEIREIEHDMVLLAKHLHDFNLYQKTDNALHDLLASVEPNSIIQESLYKLKSQSTRLRNFAERTPFPESDVKEINGEHLEIARAIKSKDAPRAKRAIATHLENSKNRTIDALTRNTDTQDAFHPSEVSHKR